MYNTNMKYEGIDVSHHNGTIDWSKVKQEYKFAIIRMGYGSDYPGKKADGGQDDNEFENNIKGVIENKIPFAVYLYSYATHDKSDDDNGGMDGAVESEVEHAKRLLKTIPEANKPFAVYYSLVESKKEGAVLQAGKDSLKSFAEYFCTEIRKAGYRPGIYIRNLALQDDKFDLKAFYEESEKKFKASIWIGDNSETPPDIGVSYDIWHFRDKKIEGIGNTGVNLDIMTEEFGKSIGLGD